MEKETYTKENHIDPIHRFSYFLLFFMLVFGLGLMGCEGPQGPQGEQGPEGPVGPASEDGSVMHADEGAPNEDIGAVGDYYLNQNTGELYGPKTDDGWGEPGIVLKGEDGQDGADGQNGEDGSQIHSGSGAPGGSLGVVGDFYLDEDNYDLYGPKTSSGWGSPLNLKGADGNANVTRYIFPGHDYSSTWFSEHEIDVTETEMEESAWEVYLVRTFSDGILTYHVPGWGNGGNSQYRMGYETTGSRREINILLQDGPGEEYDNIYIIRIAASNTEVMSSSVGGSSIIPDHLDVSNYEEVAEYYGLNEKDAVRISSQ